MLKKSAPTNSPSRFRSNHMKDLNSAVHSIMEQSAQLKYGGGFRSMGTPDDPRKKTGTAPVKFKGSSDPMGMLKYGVAVPGALAGAGEVLDVVGRLPGVGKTTDIATKLGGGAFVGGSFGLDFLKDLLSGSSKPSAPSTSRSKFTGI